MVQIDRAADRAREAAIGSVDLASAVRTRLDETREAVSRMNGGVTGALADTRASAGRAGDLEITGVRIEKIVDGIALISVQTTMLAISGAIEAARAGDAGAGFATVSADIRALARASGENAEQVREVVRGLQAEIGAARRDLEQIATLTEAEVVRSAAAVRRVDLVAGEIARVRATAQEILQRADLISSSSRDVVAGTQQIASAADETERAAAQAASAARQQARGAEDLAAAIEEIAELAEALQAAGD
jgi:methyl-accepting chemotaxis protein